MSLTDWDLNQVNNKLVKEISEKRKQINSAIEICRKVTSTVQSDGWKDVVSPMIDKSITDIVGGKTNGKWDAGLLTKPRTDERREYYVGYKQALIDFHNRVLNYQEQLSKYEKMLERIKKSETKKKKYKHPFEGSRYAK